jgi:hypothetical protein
MTAPRPHPLDPWPTGLYGGLPLAYTPFDGSPFRQSMGLMMLKPDDWIEIDRHYAAQTAEKRRLLARRRDDVFAALPEAEAASRELLDMLTRHLAARFPERFAREDAAEGPCFVNRATGERFDSHGPLHPLDIAGRQVQEDLCLMQASPEGYRLVGASLCFPTRWKLHDKLGKPMAGIHVPVPFYKDKLERPVDRFFDKLKEDKPVWRLNWSLTDDPELFQPTGHSRPDVNLGITQETAGEKVFLRIERQTLRRLPRTGAICFGIRIYQNPLSDLEAEPATAARLAAAVRQLPDEVIRYKSVRVFHAPLLAYLDRVAARAA